MYFSIYVRDAFGQWIADNYLPFARIWFSNCTIWSLQFCARLFYSRFNWIEPHTHSHFNWIILTQFLFLKVCRRPFSSVSDRNTITWFRLSPSAIIQTDSIALYGCYHRKHKWKEKCMKRIPLNLQSKRRKWCFCSSYFTNSKQMQPLSEWQNID